jgi:uncharacterized protein
MRRTRGYAPAHVIERHVARRLDCPTDGALRMCVVADTHSQPHPDAAALLRSERPHAILHAGDIGDFRVLDGLAAIAPLIAVRGNIDPRAADIPDAVDLDVYAGERRLLRILLTHIAVNGPKLRADVLALARKRSADMVICGHSHVPFIGRDRGVLVLNPGSIGPRRFQLPITFAVLEIAPQAIRPWHVSCETGKPWLP